MEELIGYAATIVTVFASAPQAIKTIKTKKTRDLSLGMWVLYSLSAFLWLSYGVVLQDVPLIVTNVVTFSLNSTILLMKIKFG